MNKIKNLYPSTKLILFITIGIVPFFIDNPWSGFVAFAITCWIAFANKIGARFLKLVRNTLLVLSIFMFIMRALFITGKNLHYIYELGALRLSSEGVTSGLFMSGRMLALGGALMLFFELTSTKDIVANLENAGANPKVTYVILASLQMIPEMKKQSNTIMEAQQSRGIETSGNVWIRLKALVPSITPLVLSSIMNTEEKALTLEARAFTRKGPKTSLYKINKTKIDKYISLICIFLILILLFGRTYLWLK